MRINWNIVNRSGEAYDAVADRLRPKIAKLEKLLEHFPADAVHLQIVLDTRPADKTYEVSLNLRVPSDVLHVGKESHSLVAAVDEAVHTLVRRLKRLKARYRKDHAWKHRREPAAPERPAAFAETPLREHEGPQTLTDTVVEVLKRDYERLLGFVSRRLQEHVVAGTLPDGAVDAHDIVNRVAEEVLRHPGLKPEAMDYRAWCSALAFQQTRQAVRRFAREANVSVPFDLGVAPEPPPAGEDDMEPQAFALNALQERMEPDEPTLADITPDPQSLPPERGMAERGMAERGTGRADLLAGLRRASRAWPAIERETFQLHFLEGMSVDDLAQAFACERSAVAGTVARLRARLQAMLSEQEEISRPAPASRPEGFERHLRALADDASGRGKG